MLRSISNLPATCANLFLATLIIGFAGSALAADEPTGLHPATTSQDQPAAPKGLMELPLAELTPRLLDIRVLLENEKATLDELRAQYMAATSDAEALRIQRRIHDVKRGTETGLLKIQLKHARLDGNAAAVSQLEETLRQLDNPPVFEAPQDRPTSGQNR